MITKLDKLSYRYREALGFQAVCMKLGFEERHIYAIVGPALNPTATGYEELDLAFMMQLRQHPDREIPCFTQLIEEVVGEEPESVRDGWDAARAAWNASSQEARDRLYRSSKLLIDAPAFLLHLAAKGIKVPLTEAT